MKTKTIMLALAAVAVLFAAGSARAAVLACVNATDCDGDGVSDSSDNCPLDPNGNCRKSIANCDVDGDGTLDSQEMGAGSQADFDGNGEGDACDDGNNNGKLDYLEGDSDGDGKRDPIDNCPDDYNRDQADFDHDGVGDACDNCWRVANSGQEDDDKDGFGDVCGKDYDGDGVYDDKDNCPTKPNEKQEDADKDGKGDVCDASPLPSGGLTPPPEPQPSAPQPYSGDCSLVPGASPAVAGSLLSACAWFAAILTIGARRRR